MWKQILVCLSFVVLISFVFSSFSSSVVYAEKGDLYKKHEQELKKPQIYIRNKLKIMIVNKKPLRVEN